MRKLALIAVAVTLCACLATAASAYEPKVWDDLSWWGQSGAQPGPYKDAVRSGYWWWPTQPASNVNDTELWGNRGVVYAQYTPPAPPEPKKVEEPTPPPPPKVKRIAPKFNNILFDFDKSALKPEGKAEIDKVVADLKEFPEDTLEVQGHTCDVGTDEYNMGLGQRRADSVKAYMIEAGIAADRIATKSLGESDPAVPNDTPANRKLNRRAVFVTVVNTMVPKQ